MAKAKHRKPSKTAQTVQRAAVVTTGTALAAGSTLVFPSEALAQPASAWDSIIRCESGGQNIPNSSGASTASGYFQITNPTWGGAFGMARAMDATFEQQAQRAQQIAENRGSLADWNASASCWNDEISNEVPDAPATNKYTATPPPPPAPAPVVEEVVTPSETYTVVEGDTLVKIGQAINMAWEDIAALNGLTGPWTIFPGQVLQVNAPTIEHVVVEGDTLNEIASTYNVPTWQEIYEKNIDTIGSNPNMIFPGQVFFVGGLRLPNPPVKVEEVAPDVEVVTPVAPETLDVVGSAIISNSSGEVSQRTRDAANRVVGNVRGSQLITIGGTRSSARDMAGHPSGNALDYMVLGDAPLGNAILDYHFANWDSLGVDYIIWQQRYFNAPYTAGDWMADRGSATQNHYDHVHVNYLP